jgi:aminodeoxychorismate synthase component I
MNSLTPIPCKFKPVAPPGSIDSLIKTVARQNQPSILESVDHNSSGGRYSIFCWDPVDIITFGEHDLGNPWQLLEDRISPNDIGSNEKIPFSGGWIGFVSYEAGYWLERIAPLDFATIPSPILRFAYYDTAIVADHLTNTWYVSGTESPGARTPLDDRLGTAERLIESCSVQVSGSSGGADCPMAADIHANMSRDDFLAAVRRIQEYIGAGDVYQVNVAQRFHTKTTAAAVDLYQRLRRSNPAAYSAMIAWDDSAVLSSSPELFLQLDANRVVTTRPIKGTRPRSDDNEMDELLRDELRTSEKDHAELAMIVDLLRNDLGRVCQPGTVRVESAADIEKHPTVWHLVATITGRLNSNASRVDLLRAAFPGGSITGAPKIRAMQIIHELEPHRRGVYCGGIGFFSATGHTTFNIAIRTLWLNNGTLSWHAGGGIVADSIPEAEYEETLAKAAGLNRIVNNKSM